MGSQHNSRKSAETFVQWKETSTSQGHGACKSGLSTKAVVTRKQQAGSNFPNSIKVPSPISSFSSQGAVGIATACSSRGFRRGGEGRLAAPFAHEVHSDAGSYRRPQVSRLPLHAEVGIVDVQPGLSTVQGGRRSGTTSPPKDVYGSRVPSSSTDNSMGNYEWRSPTSQSVRQRVVDQYARSDNTEGGNNHRAQRIPYTSTARSDSVPYGWRASEKHPRIEEEEDGEEQEEEIHLADHPPELQHDSFSFYNFDTNDNDNANNENEEEEPVGVQEGAIQDANYMTIVQGWTNENETTKRRERRQAQAARQREGDRRRREGLPRNFLLVDEYTMKPYGLGIGDWRKELMLLSRKLDPSVGNINQHPEGAVKEIADWIQHTWEYSSPVKFEYVKEVIARGVTLRRTDLWKKLRNHEQKPKEVTDRCWRTLSRQLENPATVKKFESCSRANASRLNFGRTGPSGEVGVRERLRKKLCRSPEPEEIRFEMARDKGYSGRSQRKKNNDTIMHGSQIAAQLTVEVAGVTSQSGSFQGNRNSEDGKEYPNNDTREEFVNEVGIGGVNSQTVDLRGGVLAMSTEQIAQHPFVMKMMQRLEALEQRQNIALVDNNARISDNLGVSYKESEVQVPVIQSSPQEQQGTSKTLEQQGPEAPRRPGRPRKKAKQT